MNPHIVEGYLLLTSLRFDPKDISFSMGAGYMPDAEMRAMCRAFEEEIAGIYIPRFLYTLFDFESAGTYEVGMNGIYLKTGVVITPYLKDAADYALLVATAGREFEAFQHETCARGDILRESLLGTYGSTIAEATICKVCRRMETQMFASGCGVSHPHGPGYCGWRVTQQQLLLNCLSESPYGIQLSDSSLTPPIKSVSGILACGPHVVERKHGCELCSKADCYKNRNKLKR